MNLKKCSCCGEEKKISEYHFKGKQKQWCYSQCKKCFSEYVVNRYVILKQKALEYKGSSCVKCGYNKYYGALHFHHRDPKTKEFKWSQMKKKSWNSIIKELDKCDVLCANCHSEYHGEID